MTEKFSLRVLVGPSDVVSYNWAWAKSINYWWTVRLTDQHCDKLTDYQIDTD